MGLNGLSSDGLLYMNEREGEEEEKVVDIRRKKGCMGALPGLGRIGAKPLGPSHTPETPVRPPQLGHDGHYQRHVRNP